MAAASFTPVLQVRISQHAVERWQQRVNPLASSAQARSEIVEVLEHGRVRGRPRWWQQTTHEPGTRYVIFHHNPGVCVIVRDGCAVTVVTRHGRPRPQPAAPREPRRQRARLHPDDLDPRTIDLAVA